MQELNKQITSKREEMHCYQERLRVHFQQFFEQLRSMGEPLQSPQSETIEDQQSHLERISQVTDYSVEQLRVKMFEIDEAVATVKDRVNHILIEIAATHHLLDGLSENEPRGPLTQKLDTLHRQWIGGNKALMNLRQCCQKTEFYITSLKEAEQITYTLAENIHRMAIFEDR